MTVWAVVPAAGIGSRMQVSIPKQYLCINGQTVLSLTLARLSALADIKRIMVVLNPEDSHWARHHPGQDMADDNAGTSVDGVQGETGGGIGCRVGGKLLTCHGGDDRWQSVLNGLDALADMAAPDDWVLVHDAVRPCVRIDDILQLLALAVPRADSSATTRTVTANDTAGGLLALPVTDTLKRAGAEGCVAQTVDRTALWAACTPQLFPFERLRQTLRDAAAAGVTLTDEASAMEWAGLHPALIPCHKDNIKITYAEDLNLAELILQAQLQESRAASADREQFAYTGILE